MISLPRSAHPGHRSWILPLAVTLASQVCSPSAFATEAKGDEVPKALSSDPGSFVHDCLRPMGKIDKAPPSPKDVPEGHKSTDYRLYVSSQSVDGKTIDVLPAWTSPLVGCEPVAGSDSASISIADVLKSGALRSGWVYGVMVAPFKFYPHSGELGSSGTVGPYLGRRLDYATWANTWVVTGGISAVNATTKDESGQAKSVPLTAWSAAVGGVFEVSKGKTPFRVGVLVGKDWVDRKSSIKYENNARTWAALQFGYDFTDR